MKDIKELIKKIDENFKQYGKLTKANWINLKITFSSPNTHQQNERARKRKVDSISNEMSRHASESKSNKRDIGSSAGALESKTKYKCGHESEPIIIDSNELSFATWLVWKDSIGFDGDKSMCFDCYCKSEKEVN